MFPSRKTVLGVVVLFVGLTATATAEDVTLRYQFKQGDKLAYSLEQSVAMEMAVAGEVIKLDFSQGMDLTWDVKSVDKNGKARINQTVTRIRFTMAGPKGKTEFDSKDGKEPTDPVGKIVVPPLKSLVGAEASMTMDSRGQVTDIKLSDKLKDSLKNNPGGEMPLNSMMTEDGMKQMWSQFGLILPEGALKKGADWSLKFETKTGQIPSTEVTMRYTFDGQETKDGKTLEKIALKEDVTVQADDGAPVVMKVKSQDNKGTALFDNKAGRLVESILTRDLTAETTAKGQTFIQKSKSTSSLKLQSP